MPTRDPGPDDVDRGERSSAWTRAQRLLWLGLAGVFIVDVLRLCVRRASWTPDEIDLASVAVAMLDRGAAWIRPTYHPLNADAFQRLGDGIVAPPLASALMAVPGLLGLRSTSAWPVLGALLMFAGVAAVVRAITPARWGAVLAAVAAVFAIAPRLLLDLLTLEAEIPLTGFGLLGLAIALGRRRGPAWAALSGALLGLAFLCKLWLTGPLVLAAAFAWWTRGSDRRMPTLAAFTAGLAATASMHLALVIALDPASFGRWLREVYFAALGTGGVAATKWSGVAKYPNWSHGAWYYPAAIVRELGVAALLAALGVWRLMVTRRRSPRLAHRRAALLGLAFGVAVLSVPRIKEPLYVLPAIAIGAALAAHALILVARTRRGPLVLACVAMAAAVVGVTLRVPVFPSRDGDGHPERWLASAASPFAAPPAASDQRDR